MNIIDAVLYKGGQLVCWFCAGYLRGNMAGSLQVANVRYACRGCLRRESGADVWDLWCDVGGEG